MGRLITMLTRFVGVASRAVRVGGNLHQVFAGMVRGLRLLGGAFGLLVGVMGGAFLDVMGKVAGVFTNLAKQAIDFDISITGLLEQAEKARRFFSELRDEMNYMSDKYGDATHAVRMLTKAAGSSIVTQSSLKSIFSSLVDAGADVNKEMGGLSKEMSGLAVEIGLLELKTGVAGSQFSQMAVKFEQTFKKKGIEKEILKIQKAMMGVGLSTANLEQLMQGLTEVTDKLAFATRGETMDMKGFSMQYMETVGVLKKFGISAQTTTTFINNLLDPENIDKNMLLLNKLGYSYEQFNDMINSGKGSEAFFDKILNNIGQIAQEANVLEDAKTRYTYLKDTLGLPPEIAAKLLKIEPYRMKEELKKLRKEMAEQEKEALYKKRLKAKEEKWQESMDMLRYEMVQPLVDLIYQNRGVMRKFAEAMKPVIQGLAALLSEFLTPISMWFGDFSKDLNNLNKEIKYLSEGDKAQRLAEFVKKNVGGFFDAISAAFINVWNSQEVQNIIIPIGKALGRLLRISMKYAMGNIFGKKGWEEATNEIDREDLIDRKRKIEKTLGLTEGSTTVYTYKGVGKSMPGARGAGGLTAAEKNLINRNSVMSTLQQQLKNVDIFKDGKIQKLYQKTEYEKMLKDLTDAILSADEQNIDMQKEIIRQKYSTLMDGKDKKQALSFLDKKLVEDFRVSVTDNKYINPKTNPGGGTITNPSIKTTEAQKTISAAAEKSGSDFKTIIAMIKKDPELTRVFGEEFAKQSSAKLNAINLQMQMKDAQITNFQKQVAELTAKLKEIEKNPMLTTLQEIQKGLFGTTIDKAKGMPIWSILSDIKGYFIDDMPKQQSKQTGGPTNTPLIQQVVNSGQETTSGLIQDVGGTQYALSNTYLENIGKLQNKNLILKQTLYLRAIAESTFTTARYLKYLAGGFIFTRDGLQTIDYVSANTRKNEYFSPTRSTVIPWNQKPFDIIYSGGSASPYSVQGGK